MGEKKGGGCKEVKRMRMCGPETLVLRVEGGKRIVLGPRTGIQRDGGTTDRQMKEEKDEQNTPHEALPGP